MNYVDKTSKIHFPKDQHNYTREQTFTVTHNNNNFNTKNSTINSIELLMKY